MSAPATSHRDTLVERLFGAALGALELYSVYVGLRLGLYDVLADGRARTADELARDASIDARYAREWAEQQAVAGFLTTDGAEDADARTYGLDDELRPVFAETGNAAHVAPFALMVAGIGRTMPALLEAYRSGGGVPYPDYGADFRDGQGEINRPLFTGELSAEWLPSIAHVHERLSSDDPAANVCEIGCGQGWASVGIARAYPHAKIDGFDLDPASIDDAIALAEREGLSHRVRFECRDVVDLVGEQEYDLVLILEALHDMSRPVEALRTARGLLAPGGTLLVVDERVADTFAAPGDEVERLMYGWSVLHCLPVGLAEQPSAATGTVMRTSTLEGYAREAGFDRVEVLPIENDFLRVYRLNRP